MKNLKFVSLIVATILMGLGFTACEKDSVLTDEDDGTNEWVLEVNEGSTDNVTVYVNDLEPGATSVDVIVKFTSPDSKMRRLYLTRNLAGAGVEKYELDIAGLEKKKDGSLDLSKNEKKEFTFRIPFNLVSDMKEGTDVYELWATSGIGDYRNMEKRLVVGPGTVTINYGGTNPNAKGIKEYTAKIFAAPLGDGTSESFISLSDGQLYKINEGVEMAYYWDFGYYYGGTNNASLASTFDYPTNVVNIPVVAELENGDDLNHCYFALSEKTSDEFDEIKNASQLNSIAQPESETITKLQVGDIVEFVDGYGKKGLIKVVKIQGTYNLNDYIELDIKVQR